MRKKDEEWLRTGTFCAAWGRMIAQTLSGYSSKRPIVTDFRSFSRGFHVCMYSTIYIFFAWALSVAARTFAPEIRMYKKATRDLRAALAS